MAPQTDVPIARGLEELEPVERRRQIVHSVVVAVATAIGIVAAYLLIPWEGQAGASLVLRLVLALALLVAASVISVRHVLRAEFPVLRAVETLTAVVVMAIVAFSSAYVILSARDAAAFSEPLDRIDALYFSLTTSTTVGFGDISPKSDPARVVVMVQMVTNVVVIGAAARVLMHAARRRIDR